jgi:glucose/arabinose dehydrogenase
MLTEDNRVVRMEYDGQRLSEPESVLTGIPNGFNHDGGRLLFGDDGNLFVSTGEIGEPELAQDRGSLGGKILRITSDGEPAPGNPVKGSPVWTMGHRNVQGLAFDDDGRLWATEFGASTWDELNLIEERRNYGWPLVEGRGDLEEYRKINGIWYYRKLIRLEVPGPPAFEVVDKKQLNRRELRDLRENHCPS